MQGRIVLETPRRHEVFAEPTPLGLIGLAVGCAALTPIAFGFRLTPAGLRTAAVLCLLFGAGCQLLAGLMGFANKNLYGGTLFTAFAFNWTLNWWVLHSLAEGQVPDHVIIQATELASLVIFVVLTYGFGFFSKLLFAFLLDIDLLYVCKALNALAGTRAFDPAVAVFTVALGALSLWIAFGLLINPVAGKAIFPIGGPLFFAARKLGFDAGLRRTILAVLYEQWRQDGFRPLSEDELVRAIGAMGSRQNVAGEVEYLGELGGLVLTPAGADPTRPPLVRLSAAGIDFYEQAVLGKDRFI